MNVELVARWLVMKPVLRKLIERSYEEEEHERSKVVISVGSILIAIVFLMYK